MGFIDFRISDLEKGIHTVCKGDVGFSEESGRISRIWGTNAPFAAFSRAKIEKFSWHILLD